MLACLAFIACGRPEPGRGGYTITFWSSNNPHEVAHAREIVDAWNERYPEWKVRHQPIPEGRSSEEVVLAAIVGGTTPDIYSNLWPGAVPQYVGADVLVRLDTFPDFHKVYSERIPETNYGQFQSRDGAFYQMPWKSNPIVLFYNRRLFEEAEVSPPLRTYSDYFEAARRLTRDTNGDGYLDRWMMDIDVNVEWRHRLFDFYTLFIAATGGKTLIDSEGKIAFDGREGVAVFDFIRRGFQEGYFPNAFFQGDVFVQEKVATHMGGPWALAQIEKFKPEGFEYGVMPVPVPDSYAGDSFTYGDPKNICIFSSAERPAIAWEFVKFMVSRENDVRLLELTHQLPIRKGLLSDPAFKEYFSLHPQYRFFAEMIPNTVGLDQSIYLLEILDIISQEFDAACLHQIRSSQEALRHAAHRTRVLLEREGS
ncbi:MAG: extracellular solute-binding protein [Fidelibacterota bacterium]